MRISILTPCFNAAKTIERAINSVQMQDHKNWEHIVVDGGSTDGTVGILERSPKIRWKSEPDRGQADAMNKAIQMATGDVLVFLNADDEFFPNAFSSVTKLLEENIDANIVIGRFEMRSSLTTEIVAPKLNAVHLIGEFGTWPYNPVSYFYRKELQSRIGSFPISCHYAMDYWWLLRALPYAKTVYVDEVFGCFHNYDGNKTSEIEKSDKEKSRIKRQFLVSPSGIGYLSIWAKSFYWRWVNKREKTRIQV